MPPLYERRNSFILRIWWEVENDRNQKVWRGWIQHVPSGETTYIQNVEGLLYFIEQWTDKLSESNKLSQHLK